MKKNKTIQELQTLRLNLLRRARLLEMQIEAKRRADCKHVKTEEHMRYDSYRVLSKRIHCQDCNTILQ